ncbi:MAG: hypothetical protein GY757_17565 [bacterium]|nr:hypothetical protein [bacterium]
MKKQKIKFSGFAKKYLQVREEGSMRVKGAFKHYGKRAGDRPVEGLRVLWLKSQGVLT